MRTAHLFIPTLNIARWSLPCRVCLQKHMVIRHLCQVPGEFSEVQDAWEPICLKIQLVTGTMNTPLQLTAVWGKCSRGSCWAASDASSPSLVPSLGQQQTQTHTRPLQTHPLGSGSCSTAETSSSVFLRALLLLPTDRNGMSRNASRCNKGLGRDLQKTSKVPAEGCNTNSFTAPAPEVLALAGQRRTSR